MDQQSDIIISLRNVTRRFTSPDGAEVRVLEGLDLDITRGSFNVIRGESGSGKTTLLRILGILDTKFEGDYLLDGVAVRDNPEWFLDELRAGNMGFIFQESRLFRHMTLRRNIELPLTLHGHDHGRNLREPVDALANQFYNPDEMDAGTLDKTPGAASGGQGQRASIMRAVMNEPAIILADEPTASLHGTLKKEIVQHLLSLCEMGHTVIVVSHDDVFFGAGRQLMFNEGRLHEVAQDQPRQPSQKSTALPAAGPGILWGWRPRAPFSVLLKEALRETVLRPLFVGLILVAVLAGVCQVAVFASVILGARDYVNEQISKGSRLNRVQVKPLARNLDSDDRFPERADLAALPGVAVVVPRRATTIRAVVQEGDPKPLSVMGLQPDDPEYQILTFIAGGGFSGEHDMPEVILTADIVPDLLGPDAVAPPAKGAESAANGYGAVIGKEVVFAINRFNVSKDKVREDRVRLKVVGVILRGEGGRQAYLPGVTLRLFDSMIQDRALSFSLPDNPGPGAWPDKAVITERTSFPWEDNLQIYTTRIEDVLPVYTRVAKMGLKPASEIWDFKWALDVQDTAWSIFVPLLILILSAVIFTVVANIFISAKLRQSELALWRVLGMRRGDLVATQVMSVALTVTTAAALGLGAAALLVRQIRAMLEQRSLESAAALGSEPQDFDAIFAPVGQFFWPGVAAAVLVGVVAALYPSYVAARTDPAKVLQS